ncbi:hypothetical protein [Nocardia salmonicida]|uniref:hypothetical protein n=1 Tax=Nocardia salmonicida TaxID=53431 RepID=UPI0007A4FBAE|nr:hypothetical protein [Nocardia salmonicida]
MHEHSAVGGTEVEDSTVLNLASAVQHRLRMDIGDEDADEVINCLRTARELLQQMETDSRGLRLAASAAYNLREALNRVVGSHDPAEGGLPLVLTAWATYEAQVSSPDSDREAARATFESVMRKVASGESRASGYARKLIAQLRFRAGVEPLDSAVDPVSEFQELLDGANKGLHGDLSDLQATQLVDRVLAWFGRVFAPPDEVADQIMDLAAEPWTSPSQTLELERLAANSHHLRLFFAEVQDPAWLSALYSAGLVTVPSHEEGWPVAALAGGAGHIPPARVAELLEQVLCDVMRLPTDQRLDPRFEILRVAIALGAEGRSVVAAVAKLHADNGFVQALAVRGAQEADPSDLFVDLVADAVLNHTSPFPQSADHETAEILSRLVDGLTPENFVQRGRMLASKTRRKAKDESEKAAFRWLGVEALGLDMPDQSQTLPLFAHHLSRMISIAPQHNISFDELWGWVKKIEGEVGDRLRSQVLATATDQHLTEAIAHVATRIKSAGTTAEDLVLVNSIMDRSPTEDDLEPWVQAAATPSAWPDNDDPIPADWRRMMWCWAAVLPERVLSGWTEAIDRLSEHFGHPDTSALVVEHRPQIEFQEIDHPLTTSRLSSLPPSEAIALLATHDPEGDGLTSRRFFAVEGAFEETVNSDPAAWSACCREVFDALQSEELVEAYLRGLRDNPNDAVANTAEIFDVTVPRLQQTFELPDAAEPGAGLTGPNGFEQVMLGLVRGLANKDGDIAAHLDTLWDICSRLIASAPSTGEVSSDPLERAINSRWGEGMITLLTLAHWEYRNRESIRSEFAATLDMVIALSSASGLELRAVIASRRPLLEVIATEWLESRLRSVFMEDPFGRQTFDLTVKWSYPTPWLRATCRDDLFDAAKREVDNATDAIAIGLLNNEPGYDIATIIDRLDAKVQALAQVVERIAFFVQDAGPDSVGLTRAIQTWDYLISAETVSDKQVVLEGTGRWAFVKHIDDDRWLQMTADTLAVTRSRIGNHLSIANRIARIPGTDDSCTIILAMLDYPENPWDRQYIAERAIEMLRSWPTAATTSAHKLLARLIDLGYFAARNVVLPTDGQAPPVAGEPGQ